MTPKELIKKVAEDIRDGNLSSFAPLISLFVMAGKELSLKGREPLLPFFKTVLPKRVTGMFGRQVSKSWTTAETSILKAGMVPGMNTLIVEPRFEQKKRFNDQILNPLLTGFKLSGDIIGKDDKSSMELKTFKNGNYLMLGNSYSSADSLRGTSGVSVLCVDECILSTSLVCTYDVKNNEIIHKKISEIKPNDILTSFIDDAMLYAVTPNGAQFRGTRPCYRITTKTGRVLECTEGHIIPTNIGNMRLSQIVEYVYGKRCVDEKSRRRANHRDPIECDNGVVVGGCEYSPVGENIESYNVESRFEAARVQFTQVLPVTRARYKRTVDLAESRLRRLLVEIESESKEDVSLVVLDAVSCHVDKEDRDKRVSILHNTPDSAGLVVHGRRQCIHKRTWRFYLHKWLLRRRESVISRLAAKEMGRCCTSAESETHVHWKGSHLHQIECGRVHSINATDRTVHSGMYEIQNKVNKSDVSGLRYYIYQATKRYLQRGVSEDLQESEERRRLSESHRRKETTRQGSETCLETCTSRRDKCCKPRSIQEPHRRAERTTKAARQDISREEQRCDKCKKASLSCTDEGRSEVSSKTESRESCLLSEEKERSGTLCTHAGTCACLLKETGCTREEHGSTASTSCKEEGAEICKLIEPQDACYFYDPIVSIEYIGEHDVYDLEVVGTHNFILGNGICVHNCQDINPDFLPVIEATTDASVDFGLINYFGTAKTSDGTLAMLFSQSSQGHWCIQCEGCGKYNIAAPDEQLFKMIGKKGCICAFCGKLLPFFTGKYVHKYPEKVHTHAGYHTPQIAFYIHCGYENKWNDLLYKMENWDKTLFYNEVLGIPDDESTRILTLKDLVEAQNNLDNSIQTALEARRSYDMVTLGVDWSGGGSGASTTAIVVIGMRHFTTVTDCIYMCRFKQGMSAEEEADAVAALADRFRADYIAHDYTGAGYVREAFLVSRHPQWMNNMFPVSYCYKPNADMISFQQSGSRVSYSVDKTKSLLITLSAVRHKQITVPKFDVNNENAVQRDLLAIVERSQEMNKGSSIYLLERAPGKSDDGAHALNIGFVCQCTATRHYPVFSASDKYNMTEEQIFNLVGPDIRTKES